MMNAPELDLPHCNMLVAQGDWLYQILNCIIGRSSLRLFMIGLILNLQFHGGWFEADGVEPSRLQDILFAGTGKKGEDCGFGPVVADSIGVWRAVERRIGGPFKFCNSTPLWHNFNFVCGNRPFVQPSWSSLGVNTCGDMCDDQGLCSFRTLGTRFCLPAFAYLSFFSGVLLSRHVAFLGPLPFPLILCGTGLRHLLVGHLFP